MKIKLDNLDKLFSKFVRLRAGGICEYCGQNKVLQCSHFVGRRKRSVRFDPDNAAGLCFSCHMYLGENPHIHTDWFRKRLGSERFENLNIRSNIITKIDRDKIEADLKERIKLLEK